MALEDNPEIAPGTTEYHRLWLAQPLLVFFFSAVLFVLFGQLPANLEAATKPRISYLLFLSNIHSLRTISRTSRIVSHTIDVVK
jgi:hypothetical protein